MLIYHPNISIFTNISHINIDLNNSKSFSYNPAFNVNSVHIRVFKDKPSNVVYDISDNDGKSYIYSHKDLKNISKSDPNYNFHIKPFKNRFNEYNIDYIDITINNNDTIVQMFKDNNIVPR